MRVDVLVCRCVTYHMHVVVSTLLAGVGFKINLVSVGAGCWVSVLVPVSAGSTGTTYYIALTQTMHAYTSRSEVWSLEFGT